MSFVIGPAGPDLGPDLDLTWDLDQRPSIGKNILLGKDQAILVFAALQDLLRCSLALDTDILAIDMMSWLLASWLLTSRGASYEGLIKQDEF